MSKVLLSLTIVVSLVLESRSYSRTTLKRAHPVNNKNENTNSNFLHPGSFNSRINGISVPDVGVALYDSQLWFSHLVETQFTVISPISLTLLFLAGLLTSFSPCSMGLIPLTLAYLGGDSEKEGTRQATQAALYAVGLSLTLSLFGLSAAFLGEVYGVATAANPAASSAVLSEIPPAFSAALSLVMGFNLLELVDIRFPSFEFGDFGSLPAPARALLLGSSSALIASPCASPVLASLLAVIASSHNPALGASLLFTYSLGYATPVVVAGAVSGKISVWMASRGAQWVNTVMASALIVYGTYNSKILTFS